MKAKEWIKKIAGTLMLPVIMYLIVMVACLANGKTYFGSWAMWKSLMVNIAVSVTCAMGIGLQFKCGRFDFSGGAIMLLAAILAGNTAKSMGNSPIVFAALCLVLCVAFSLLVGLVYIYGRLPIVIATIGMALLYESVTCLVFRGAGINLVSNTTLKAFSSYPLVLVPTVCAIAVYYFFGNVTVSGRQSVLLSMNQQAAVNIGVNENKNVLVSYLFSGLIFGFATMIYASTGLHDASYSSLTTVGELFSNILPVFIGLMLGSFCNDTIGTLMGSITLCLMSFGLTTVISSEMGNSISMILTGVFVLVINVASGQGAKIIAMLKRQTQTSN